MRAKDSKAEYQVVINRLANASLHILVLPNSSVAFASLFL